MKFILPYKLFEQEEPKRDLLDKVLFFLPKLRNDEFTDTIIPHLRVMINTEDSRERYSAYKEIRSLAKGNFGGNDRNINFSEVLERFVNHYIDRPGGILLDDEVIKLIRKIKPPVKRSKKWDKKARIGVNEIDNFTDRVKDYLKNEGMIDGDITNQFKTLYKWAMPTLKYFYHVETIRTFKYLQPNILFSEGELHHMIED